MLLPPRAAEGRRPPGSATSPSPGCPRGRRSGAADGRGRAARPEAAALPGAGQAGDLPLHGRRAVARRHLRLQAEAHRRRRQAVSARACRRRPSCSPRPGSSSSTARAGCGSPTCSPRSPSTPTTSASSTACRPTCRTTRRRSCRCTRGIFQFPRPSLGAWMLYGLGTENENLPGFVTLCPPVNNGGPSNYGSASCRRSTRGRGSASTSQPVADATVSNITNPRSGPRRPAAAARLRPVAEPRGRSSATRSTRPSKG